MKTGFVVSITDAQEAWAASIRGLELETDLDRVRMREIRMHMLIEAKLGEKYPGNPLNDPRTRVFYNTCKGCGTDFMSSGRPLKFGLCEACLKRERARLLASRAYRLYDQIDWVLQPMQ